MTAMVFVDTNVLLYAASHATADREKREIARQVLADSGIHFSAQVLQEFYVAAVTKQRLEMTHDEALAVLKSLAAFPIQSVTSDSLWRQFKSSSDSEYLTGMRPFLSRRSNWAAVLFTVKTSTTVKNMQA